MAGDFFRSAVLAVWSFGRAALVGAAFAVELAADVPELPVALLFFAAVFAAGLLAGDVFFAGDFRTGVFPAGFLAVVLPATDFFAAALRAAVLPAAPFAPLPAEAFFAAAVDFPALGALFAAGVFFAPAFWRTVPLAADLPFASFLLASALRRGLVFSVGVAAMICLCFLTDLPSRPRTPDAGDSKGA